MENPSELLKTALGETETARASSGRIRADLSDFENGDFDRGASKARELAWIAARSLFFERGPIPLDALRLGILSRFGAQMGAGSICRRGFRVTFPWKLEVGSHCWLGEDAWLLNLAPIRIGNSVCISQRAFLCAGNHDWSHHALPLVTAPITVHDGAWIGASAFVGPGVTIGDHCVVTAGSVVTGDLPPYTICSGNPCRPVKERKILR
ncbi:MAG: transferase hexapeptide repeat containing protein [Myxococcaceae bacterium]|nr:transferase hexapeptide repeat containing protein [Myxococcaceae bacterium]